MTTDERGYAARDKAAIERVESFFRVNDLAVRGYFARCGWTPVGGPERWRSMVKQDVHVTGVEWLIAAARQGDVDADQVLRDIAAATIEQSFDLGDALRAYVADSLKRAVAPKRPRGKPPKSHRLFDRDLLIATAVGRTIGLGYKLTRNAAAPRRLCKAARRRHSACSIVAAAVALVIKDDLKRRRDPVFGTLSEKAVEKIWREHAPKYGHRFGEWPQTKVIHLGPRDPLPLWVPRLGDAGAETLVQRPADEPIAKR